MLSSKGRDDERAARTRSIMSASRWEDEAALGRLVDLYARAVDRGDVDLLASLFTNDATLDFGAMFSGSKQAFAEMIRVSMRTMTTHHFMGNRLFAVQGETAEGEIYSMNTHRLSLPGSNGRDYVAAGRYLDRYRRTEHGWRFAHRTRVIDWTNEGLSADGVITGGKRNEDPSASFPLLSTLAPS